MHSLTRRAVRATITATALAAVAMIGLTAPAHAAPLVDPDQTGSITVHKFEKPAAATGLPNNGTVVDTSGLTPLAGVTFEIRPVNPIDLSTNAGWADAADLAAEFDASDAEGSVTGAGYTLGAATSEVTATDGTAVFGDLPVGLYLVQETAYPSGVTPAAPFLITVPLTDPTGSDTWIYDVHVYPKNSLTEAAKTVDDLDAIQLGDEVVWTITAGIPNESVIDGYKIVDPLDASLDYVDTLVTLSNGATITEGTHYTVTHDASNAVTVEFTAAGRAVLAANNTADVVVDVVTTVNTVGEIQNQALVYPNAASFDIDPGEPGGPAETNVPETRWGGITLEKTDGTSALTGASFQVFTSAADAAAQTNPVSLGGQTTFTVTAADGTLTLSGLRYSDFAGDATVAPGDPGYLSYYLVETVAPSGFELLAEPIPFTVTAATSAIGVDLEVVNVAHNAGFELPQTGGTGTGLLYVFGFALIAGGVLLLVLRRRTHASRTRP
ncbi:SpaH/EbpB family LPXTG-anchored major pilin [Microbacterium sp. LjRoot45]|uniref:SpaH/EbpB family LPXTG-anchored major pilin n=1 Tax=Microbacterium sp. LjRoot45 TaxID=3342329 RepID=UPI003ED0F033